MDQLTSTLHAALEQCQLDTLKEIFASTSGPNSWNSVGQGEQRSLAADFLNLLVTRYQETTWKELLNSTNLETYALPICQAALQHLPATVPSAADSTVRQALFDTMIASNEPDYITAARILGGTRMDDDRESVYYVSPVNKVHLFVQQAECFLAEDEHAESDAAVQKAGTAVAQLSTSDQQQHTALLLRYKSTTARVLDANRKFLAAATRYHELSTTEYAELLDADELLQLLGRAVTCAVLAPPSPPRERLMQSLVRDERLVQLDALTEFRHHRKILEDMVHLRIIPPSTLEPLEAGLAVHQKAVRGDGLTILQRGVVEHNLQAVAQVYQNIRLNELAVLLNVPEPKATEICANMIRDGALPNGTSMDEVSGLLEFPVTTEWDDGLIQFCTDLNRVAGLVTAMRRDGTVV